MKKFPRACMRHAWALSALCVASLLPARGSVIVNGDLEATPWDQGWNNGVATAETVSPLDGAVSARFGFGTSGNLDQALGSPLPDFEVDLVFKQLGATDGRTLNTILMIDTSPVLNLRILVQGTDGVDDDSLQVYDGSDWQTLSAPDFFSTTQAYRINIQGHDWGTSNPTYDVQWSDAGSSTLSYQQLGLTYFENAAAAETKGFNYLRFARPNANANSWLVDNVSVQLVVPEPGTLALLAAGLAGLQFWRTLRPLRRLAAGSGRG